MDIGTIIDIVLACIFCVSLVSGWHQGLVMKVASLIVVGVSYILAGILSKQYLRILQMKYRKIFQKIPGF